MGNGYITNKSAFKSAVQNEQISNNSSPSNITEKNKKKILAFYSTFKFYLNKYELDGIRKYRIDCFMKRAKSKFIKSLHYAINYCLNINVERLPQTFVLNIKIEVNKKYLFKTIEEIYTEFKIIPTLDEILKKKLVYEGREELFSLVMKGTFEYIYQIYLMSKLYYYHRNQVIKKNGEGVGVLYDFIANNLCNYYQYSEVSQFKKNKKALKKIFETERNSTGNNINSNNNIKNDDIDTKDNDDSKKNNIKINDISDNTNFNDDIKNNNNIKNSDINFNYDIKNSNNIKNNDIIFNEDIKNNNNNIKNNDINFNYDIKNNNNNNIKTNDISDNDNIKNNNTKNKDNK